MDTSSANRSNASSTPALGFLTVLDDPQNGLFGGYLVLNMEGRPLEFHCTAPIKPNRAQEILYGPTLESFLVWRADRSHPACAGENRAAAGLHGSPACLDATRVRLVASSSGGVGRQCRRGNCRHFASGKTRWRWTKRREADQPTIHERLADLGDSFDLAEPFQRIREAIEEAQQAVR